MRKFLFFFLIAIFIVLSIALTYFLFKSSQKDKKIYETIQPKIDNIVVKSLASGTIKPVKEIAIKPRVSGILQNIYIMPGDKVKKGDLLARIKVVPNMSGLVNAQVTLQRADLSKKNAIQELERQQALLKEGLISQKSYNETKLSTDLAKAEHVAAIENLQIIEKGTSSQAGISTTLVHSTVSGMILEAPFKEGSSVIESNNFNEGSTIAIIADTEKMIFEGKVDEAEVGKLREGMDLVLKIGALEKIELRAKLDYIAPKGVEEEGAITFIIKASINHDGSNVLRVGYSANADIILSRKDSVLVVEEQHLIFENDSTFVEVEIEDQKFKKQPIITGLSDGIHIEVLEGLTLEHKIKKL